MNEQLEGGLRCTKVKHEAYHSMNTAHSHAFFEVFYLLSGQRKLTMNQKIFELESGDLALIPPNTIHRTSYRSNHTHERIAIKFEEYVLSPLFQNPDLDRDCLSRLLEPTIIHIPETHRTYAEDLMMKIFYENEKIDIFSNSLKQCYLLELLLLLFRCKQVNTASNPLDITHESVQAAVSYIYEHYYETISLTDIAEHFGMSSSYFSKKFRIVTGFGFKEYLTGVRIQKATELLLTTKQSITDIALCCGFNDSNYFGDAFKKVKGVSPAKFRKNKGLV